MRERPLKAVWHGAGIVGRVILVVATVAMAAGGLGLLWTFVAGNVDIVFAVLAGGGSAVVSMLILRDQQEREAREYRRRRKQ